MSSPHLAQERATQTSSPFRVAVIVPAYNEERFLARSVHTIPPWVDHILIVNDGSTDGTARGMEGLPMRNVLRLHHVCRRGPGAAVKTGLRAACRLGVDVAVVVAGDGQTDNRDIGQFVASVFSGGTDYAKGNRFLMGDARRSMPWLRYAGNRILSCLTRLATGYRQLGDSQCGFFALSREVLESLEWDGVSDGYGFVNDILFKLRRRGFRVLDIPTPAIYGEERSKICLWRDVPRMAAILLRGFLGRFKPSPQRGR